MGREGRDYWEAQLSEYWDSGLTIQEYSELKELPYESTRRWIRVPFFCFSPGSRNFLPELARGNAGKTTELRGKIVRIAIAELI